MASWGSVEHDSSVGVIHRRGIHRLTRSPDHGTTDAGRRVPLDASHGHAWSHVDDTDGADARGEARAGADGTDIHVGQAIDPGAAVKAHRVARHRHRRGIAGPDPHLGEVAPGHAGGQLAVAALAGLGHRRAAPDQRVILRDRGVRAGVGRGGRVRGRRHVGGRGGGVGARVVAGDARVGLDRGTVLGRGGTVLRGVRLGGVGSTGDGHTVAAARERAKRREPESDERREPRPGDLVHSRPRGGAAWSCWWSDGASPQEGRRELVQLYRTLGRSKGTS